MRNRIITFINTRSYSTTARVYKVDPASIRKQMQGIKNKQVQLLVKQLTRKKYKYCTVCDRDFNKVKYLCKGLCQACYKLLRYKTDNRRIRRVYLTN